jgi:hypothetical protein
LIHALSLVSGPSARSMNTLTFGSAKRYRPVRISERMIESPSGPSEAMTTFSLVPGGKLTMRVLGSVPSSTLRSVGVVVDWTGVLTSGFVIFESTTAGVSEGVGGGTARASGTPITTTYIKRNPPTNPRPYCTKCWKSPPAPLPPHARFAHYEGHKNERQRSISVRIDDFSLAPTVRQRKPDFRTRSLAASGPTRAAVLLLITRR